MRSESVPVLKSDLFLAAIMLGTGLVTGGVEALRTVPVVGATVGALIAASLYLAEHDVVPGVYPEVTSVAAFLVTAAIAVGFVFVLSASTAVVAAAALTGGGVGVTAYRLAFGVIRPVPEYRLRKDEGPEERIDPE